MLHNEYTDLMKAIHRLAVSESGFVFDPLSGQSFTVNAVGLDLIRLMQSSPDMEKLRIAVMENYLGDAHEIERDMEAFLDCLSEQMGIGCK